MKVCSVEGCKEKYSCRGLCHKHYQKALRRGEISVVQRKEPEPCTVDGCDNFIKAKGMCTKHYQRYRTGTDINYTPKYLETCTFDGCVLKVRSLGLCLGHYAQTRRGAELKPLHTKPQNTICSIPKCSKATKSKGYCKSHYEKRRRGTIDEQGRNIRMLHLQARIEDTLDLISFGEFDYEALIERAGWESKKALLNNLPEEAIERLRKLNDAHRD